MTNPLLKISSPALLLIFLLAIIPGQSHGYSEPGEASIVEYPPSNQTLSQHMLYNFLLTESDSLSAYEKYEKSLSSLAEQLGAKGLTINDLLQDSRFEIYESINKKFTGSAEKKSLGITEYKQILNFTDKAARINDFINTHTDQLKKAEETYGISRYVISAILGVESDFGLNSGNYNPFNTYVSMYAVDYRADFAKAQLEELLIFADKRNLDVFEMKSSYAGAMSFAQFIPYSLNKWFVGDDLYDMNNNILSVGNYLAYFKERTGSVEKAVFRYNPSSLYTQLVIDLAREAEDNFSTEAP